MKKLLLGAIAILSTAACYTPMSSLDVSTNKPWVDVQATRLDFNRDQYDSCVQYNLRFWPPEAEQNIDLADACITGCCWRSEKSEVVLEFNKNFENDLKTYGVARKYSPEKITIQVSHSNFLNFTKVSVTPARTITNEGLVKLTYTQVEDKERLEQVMQEEKERVKQEKQRLQQEYVQDRISQLQHTLRNAAIVAKAQEELQSGHLKAFIPPEEPPEEAKKIDKKKNKQKKKKNKKEEPAAPQISKAQLMAQAKSLLQQQQGHKIDTYFYNMNKTYRDKEAFFVLSDRFIEAKDNADNTFTLSCYANASTGITQTSLNDSKFSCGTWLVDLTEQTVTPYDNKAIQIVNQ